MMRLTHFSIRGQKIIVTDRVKPTGLFRFQGYVLVNTGRWPALLAWIEASAGIQPRALFDERNFQ
jgi:hypothetical protein